MPRCIYIGWVLEVGSQSLSTWRVWIQSDSVVLAVTIDGANWQACEVKNQISNAVDTFTGNAIDLCISLHCVYSFDISCSSEELLKNWDASMDQWRYWASLMSRETRRPRYQGICEGCAYLQGDFNDGWLLISRSCPMFGGRSSEFSLPPLFFEHRAYRERPWCFWFRLPRASHLFDWSCEVATWLTPFGERKFQELLMTCIVKILTF